MTVTPDRTSALLIVDVQNDFCPGGALPVAGGDDVVPVINEYATRFSQAGSLVVADRDWHPNRTTHFVQFGGAWPAHCIQGTPGAEYHSGLKLPPETVHITKGMGAEEDAYSCFEGRDAADRSLSTILAERGVRTLYVVGLATDYCVKHSALDARQAGLDVVVLADACRAVNVQPGDDQRALDEMRSAGAVIA